MLESLKVPGRLDELMTMRGEGTLLQLLGYLTSDLEERSSEREVCVELLIPSALTSLISSRFGQL